MPNISADGIAEPHVTSARTGYRAGTVRQAHASDHPVPRLHLVDTTMFFASEGGGVGRYLAAKQDWLARQSTLRHTIVAPGARDAIEHRGLVSVRSPRLPGLQGYRFPLRLSRWTECLVALEPD